MPQYRSPFDKGRLVIIFTVSHSNMHTYIHTYYMKIHVPSMLAKTINKQTQQTSSQNGLEIHKTHPQKA